MDKKAIQKLKEQSVDELNKQLVDLTKEQVDLRMRNQVGQVEKPSRIREVRRDIARVKTTLKQRQLAA